jgi:hypothetical protein
MGRILPNIDMGTTLKKRDRLGFKNFVLDVITDTFLFDFIPDKLELLGGIFFQLTLENKKILVDQLQVDNPIDYIDVYLYGVKQPQNRYTVSINGNNIVITFTEDITRLPEDVIKNDFKIKGKIGEI